MWSYRNNPRNRRALRTRTQTHTRETIKNSPQHDFSSEAQKFSGQPLSIISITPAATMRCANLQTIMYTNPGNIYRRTMHPHTHILSLFLSLCLSVSLCLCLLIIPLPFASKNTHCETSNRTIDPLIPYESPTDNNTQYFDTPGVKMAHSTSDFTILILSLYYFTIIIRAFLFV